MRDIQRQENLLQKKDEQARKLLIAINNEPYRLVKSGRDESDLPVV